jgi:uncharacterized protein YbaP (TraB family)
MHTQERETSAFRRLSLVLAGFAGLLLTSAFPAQAAESACGTNLLAGLEQRDPSKLQQIRTAAEKTPNGHGLLWRVDAEGTRPSYIFGTMHLSDERVLDLPAPVADAFDGADTVLIETTDVLDRSAVAQEVARQPHLMMFPEGESLTDHLTNEDEEELRAWLQERGVSFETIIKMRPWMILSMASQPACETKRQAEGAKILDFVLAERAEQAGKELAGLETLAEQFAALGGFPTEVQLRALLGTAAMGDKADDVIETLISLYLDGETGMFTPAVLHLVPHDADELDDYTRFEQQVVIKRNHLMATRAVEHLERGNAFIAVGALHLPGNEGIIELLRNAGWTVVRAD